MVWAVPPRKPLRFPSVPIRVESVAKTPPGHRAGQAIPFQIMSLVLKLAGLIKSIDRMVWPDHRVAITPEVAETLRQHNMMVADVGSADGPEEIWLSLREFIHFLTFEPNPRPAQPTDEKNVTNFPIGLWSEKTRKTLYLTKHPDSGSLLPINQPLFADYMVHTAMELARATQIDLDTLDHLLADKPDLSPDFLKIDVEGADLEVLKGAEAALARSILGLRVETAFVELHLGAPLLWDIDVFLRERGFVLFHLGRNHFIRNNGLHGHTSEPQLIWGDAVYFLGRESFLKRLAALDEGRQKAVVAKFVVMLVRHGVHDYAWDMVEAARVAGRIPREFAEALQALVKNSMDTSAWYFIKAVLGVVFALLIFVASCPLAEPRKRAVYYVKQRVGRLGHALSRWAALQGRIPNSFLGDPFV